MAELRLLGPVEVIGQDGSTLHVGGPKERALLALLACHPGEVVSEDRLVDALWLEEPPRTAKRTLQSYLSRVRRTLSSANGSFALESHPGGWALQVSEGVLDVARVEAHAASARAAMQGGDFVRAALAFRDALSEWRGRPFEEFSDHPWAVLEGARLRELHQALLEERVDADLGCGRHAELTAELERMCRAHPLRERLWGQLMLAYYRCGR
jgi:DNA-binding SARP family transcriptional activator